MSERVPIAIVGMACRYPDARSPIELWENALAQRRAFRRIPAVRLRAEDYYSPDSAACDSIYMLQAAVIEGYEFDRHRFNISGSTYRSVDLTHWLALDIAIAAVEDAGFPQGRDLPRQTTGVILGNTLTGEFSRANLLRVRWPYVRRTIESALAGEQWDAPRRTRFLADLERQFKAPFPPGNEETLAGGLSNTIAGRICNHLDLKGGGFTVDGACASSLLAVINACALLTAGELDVALAGGVDLSLDPFELVGFSRAGALAREEMRVFDVRSQGFWPGEGCGFVALMRQQDALRQGRRIYATIRGCGMSSDGAGGITRPELQGQLLCLERAYRGLDFSIADVLYFEGHGTGTAVGDATELQALSDARRQAGAKGRRAAIGSIKANIGHTKAAAGVAGLIKAAMVLHERVQPPATACERPHPLLTEPGSVLQVLQDAQPMHDDAVPYASVSAMGFGGINTHVVLQAVSPSKAHGGRHTFPAQDAELFLFDANDHSHLREQVQRLRRLAPDLSRGELLDAASAQASQLAGRPIRASVVAADPTMLTERLDLLLNWLDSASTTKIDAARGTFLGARHSTRARIGLLCPGQGNSITLDGGAITRRFAAARELYDSLPIPDDIASPQVVQPAVVRASLAAIRILSALGIEAGLAVGHSLGELTALCWAGAFDEAGILQLTSTRAQMMTELSFGGGAMASIGADPAQVLALCEDASCVGNCVSIACHNGPWQTVISGPAAGVRAIVAKAQSHRLAAVMLKTTHAFHSSLVAPAGSAFPQAVARLGVQPMRHPIVSTVTASLLEDSRDVAQLLGRQITSPVLFADAIATAAESVDLFIEVGCGEVLSSMVVDLTDVPAVAVNVGGESICGLLKAVGAAFVLGTDVIHANLFRDRLVRPFSLDRQPKFFASPCESAPVVEDSLSRVAAVSPDVVEVDTASESPACASILDVLRQVIASQEELQPEAIRPQSHLLRDLHLNSLKVAEIVAKTCRRLGLAPPASPTEMSGATVGQIAEALERQKRVGGTSPLAPAEPESGAHFPPGVGSWVRSFKVEWLQHLLTPTGDRQPVRSAANGEWHIFCHERHPLAACMKAELSTALPGGGVALLLGDDPGEESIGMMLASARAAMLRFTSSRGMYVVVHRGGGSSLGKTMLMECPGITVCVVDVPFDHPMAKNWVAVEAAAAHGYCESRYDDDGQRWIPRLAVCRSANGAEPSSTGLSSQDVVLVSGGGKGVAAECALELACQSGARLLILGRSRPEDDAVLATNLQRLSRRGARYCYRVADVTDAQVVREAVRSGERQIGTVTAILHGAGTNTPRLISELDEGAFLQTLRPKCTGLINLLAAVDADRLRLLVTFGSVIARVGMRGEADYAVANDWMSRLVDQFAQRHPDCRCLNVEWSVWSDVGMGPRLGSIAPLLAQGIAPIPPEIGVRKMLDLLRDPGATGSLIVSGRYGDLSTLASEGKFKARRFVQTTRCFYPGVELVADAVFSIATDSYLADHVFRGRCLLPAVVGLEIMAEAAANVCGSSHIAVVENVQFAHPIEIPPDGQIVVRVAALAREDGHIDVVLRSSATRFTINHFTAVCRPRSDSPAALPDARVEEVEGKSGPDSAAGRLDPARDLYGRILFQGKTFQRLTGYELLQARQCIARIIAGDADDGLGDRRGLILGDPAARDAAIHAIQACIPHLLVLPVSVERLEVIGQASGVCRMIARERSSDSNGFIYDVSIWSEAQQLVERWSGLRLQIIAKCPPQGAWPAGLLLPYLERQIGDLIPTSTLNLAWDTIKPDDVRIQSGFDSDHRSDGKPDPVAGGLWQISRTYFRGGRLTCTGSGSIAIDAEAINGKSPEQWAQVLGGHRMALARTLSEFAHEPLTHSASRVWCATECLAKLSAPPDAPLVLANTANNWTVFHSGPITIASCVAPVGDLGELCLAVADSQSPHHPYEFSVRVGFDEVNRMGTVNFQSYFNWQGRCREAFLFAHAPNVLKALHVGDLLLVTTNATCDYVAEVSAEHEVLVRMTLADLGEHRLSMGFEYWQNRGGQEVLVARGRQEIASMRRDADRLVAVSIPAELRRALAAFKTSDRCLGLSANGDRT